MIAIKSNKELTEIFTRLVKKMGVSVKWNGIFVITNSNMILIGEPFSLVFNYENKRVYPDIFEDLPQSDEIKDMPSKALFTNLFNVTLYSFSKWGAIKGINVEKDYGQLNNLFQSILREIKVESLFTKDDFRFYLEGIQITYEDVLDIALKTIEDENDKDETHSLGLWHNVRWKLEKYIIEKKISSEINTTSPRIGSNFYLIDHICPSCKERIFMTTYPENEDILIETEEGRVYLARAYACNSCNTFYASKPEKLLNEGDVYCLEFEDDRTAYEDYLERLGQQGERNASFRFNEYEIKRLKKSKETEDEDKDKEETTIYPTRENKNNYDSEDKIKSKIENNKKTIENKLDNAPSNSKISIPLSEKTMESKETYKKYNLPNKTIDELKATILRIEKENSGTREYELIGKANKETLTPEYIEALKNQLSDKLKAKYKARLKISDRMTSKQLVELKSRIEKEDSLSEEDSSEFINQIDEIVENNEREAITKKAETAKSKSYSEINRIIDDIEHGDGLEELRKAIIDMLMETRRERGKQEVELLLDKVSNPMTKSQYELLLDKLNQYEDIDLTPYQMILEELRPLSKSITEDSLEGLSKNSKEASTKERKGLKRIDRHIVLQEGDTDDTGLGTNKIYDKDYEKTYEADKLTISRICPDVMQLSFDEALEAYEKIGEAILLPELKDNTLKMIRRRLTKIKTSENIQLVKKLKKEMERKIDDFSRLHFYEADDYSDNLDIEEDKDGYDDKVINNALNKYASNRNEFEYPILICDATGKGNGKRGFILTPDHIFFNDYMEAGVIGIKNIVSIENDEKYKKKLYVNHSKGSGKKIPIKIKQSEKKALTDVLDSFVKYLQEKPESRDIRYLAKEEHTVKCCYRCGHRYRGGSTCPKCGNKGNK